MSQDLTNPTGLGEPPRDSIQELLDSDPLELSDQDLEALVLFFRRERESFNQSERKKQTEKGKRIAPPDLTFDDLGI